MPARPALLTFDVFGTILDWREGLRAALALRGVTLGAGDLDRVIDAQGALEQVAPWTSYREIVARSLVEVLGVEGSEADAIGGSAGTWPPFLDSRPALRRLLARAPCAAMTNSDRAHGADVQAGLGFRLSRWLCAEDVGAYKPAPAFWAATAAATGAALGPAWWHVSAYADYDLRVARALGLTTVLVLRPHARPGAADLVVPDLLALAAIVEALPRSPAASPR
jgi:2-haloalkanoic acid dehalogenase type II